MKSLVYILLISISLSGCKSTDTTVNTSNEDKVNLAKNDTVSIANNDLEYELIIIEPGYNFWLETTARPRGYYEKEFMKSKNIQYVAAWNERVMQPSKYPSELYESYIYYDSTVDYGYEVNYKLYNYFIYFQLTYKQQLTGITPRI